MLFCFRLTLDDIARALMEDDDFVDGCITIIPTGDKSDGDSGEEDEDNLWGLKRLKITNGAPWYWDYES
jgi:hypothetical protein